MDTISSVRPNVGDLWTAAVATLDQEDKDSLDFGSSDRLQIVAESLRLTEAAKVKCKGKAWRFTRGNGQEVFVRDVLAKVARWINHFKGVGDSVVPYDPAHAALPWAGIRFVLQICVDHFETHELLLESISSIAEQLCRCDLIEKYIRSSQSSQSDFDEPKRALIKLYAKILIYLVRVKAYFQKTTKGQVLKGLKFTSTDFESPLKAIADAQKDLEWHFQIACMHGLKDDLARLETPMARWSNELAKITDELDKAKRVKILQWVSQEPYPKHHMRERESFLDGTGNWLLSHPVYKMWKDDSASSFLWLHGIPGSGKSKLTSLVIEDAKLAFEKQLAPQPAYFYCSRNPAEPGRSDPERILASIVRQLSSPRPGGPVLQPTVDAYDSQADGFAADSLHLQESCDLLMKLLQIYPTAIIIIDALDECSQKTRQKLLHSLERILRHPSTLVKIFVSSRDDGDIVNKLRDYPSLQLSSNLNGADIDSYVEHETRALVGDGSLDISNLELSQEIIQEVSKGAQGMFRWASLQLQALCDLVGDEAILERLGRLPPTLEALYQEVLDKIERYGSEANRRCARNALAWLLCGKKRLTCKEFLEAVSSPEESLDGVSATDRPPALLRQDQVLRLCRNLIIFDSALDGFRFAHLSVREFLESKEAYSTIKTNSIAAQCCFTALKHYKIRTRYLHGYASHYWALHCQDADVDRNGLVQGLLLEFLLNTAFHSPFGAWNRYSLTYSAYNNWLLVQKLCATQNRKPCGLYVASAFDFAEAAKFYTEQCPPVGDEILDTCASLSALYGSGKALNIFLGLKRVNIKRVVESAAGNKECGKELMASLLENHGDQIEITTDITRAAAGNGKCGKEIMRLLLEKRSHQVKITADVISAAVEYGGGGVEVLALLFEKKGDEIEIEPFIIVQAAGNQQSGKDMIALFLEKKGDQVRITEDVLIAAAENHGCGKEIFALLLDKKAGEIEITPDILYEAAGRQDDMMTSVLGIVDRIKIMQVVGTAAQNEDCGEEIIALLLEKKGDQIEITEHIVMAAVGNTTSGEKVLALLLEKRGDQIEITEDIVLYAAEYGNDEVMGMLLEKRGEQIEITTDVVIGAARNMIFGTQMLVLLLETRGDQVNITEGVLIEVAGHRNKQTMALILEKRGSQIEITADVVTAAARNRDAVGVMALLLEKKGSQIEITEDVVIAAAHHWDKSVMGLLLEQRANEIEITEGVLKAAAGNRSCGEELMSLFLEQKGDQIEITKDVFIAVARNGNEQAMALLLEKMGSQIEITADVVTAAASNPDAVEAIALLEQRASEIKITEGVLKAAAGNSSCGEELMSLFLEQKGDQIEITTDIIIVAAHNPSGNVMALLLEKRGDQIEITTDIVIAAAQNKHEDVMALLLDNRGDQVEITEDVLKTAAGNRRGKIMALLLEKRGDQIEITEDVLKAAAGNEDCGQEIMALLLENKGDQIEITEDVLKAAAGNKDRGREIMALLLENKGDQIEITSDIVKAAAGNRYGIMALLLKNKGDQIKITEDVLKAAAGNPYGYVILALLVENKGDQIEITEDVLKVAAGNEDCGREIMALLLENKGDQIEITSDIVKAVAGNPRGHKILALLLEVKGDQIEITEGVVEAVVSNPRGHKILALLLENKGDQIKITSDIVKVVAGNDRSGLSLMALLLAMRGDQIEITTDIVKAAENNRRCGKEIITLLLGTKYDQVEVPADIVAMVSSLGLLDMRD